MVGAGPFLMHTHPCLHTTTGKQTVENILQMCWGILNVQLRIFGAFYLESKRLCNKIAVGPEPRHTNATDEVTGLHGRIPPFFKLVSLPPRCYLHHEQPCKPLPTVIALSAGNAEILRSDVTKHDERSLTTQPTLPSSLHSSFAATFTRWLLIG